LDTLSYTALGSVELVTQGRSEEDIATDFMALSQ